MKSAYGIIDTILITEKTSDLEEFNQYAFKVNPDSSKIEIKQAVEKLFDVKVKSVNVTNYKGKPKRAGRSLKMGRRANWKKAFVTLSEGSIDVI